MKFSQAHVVSHRGPYPVPGFPWAGRAMAMNRIQFQAGLSMAAFFERYGTESLCTAALDGRAGQTGFAVRAVAALPIASSAAVPAGCSSATPAAGKRR